MTTEFFSENEDRLCCYGEDEDCIVCHAIGLVRKHRNIRNCRKHPSKVVWWLSQEHDPLRQKFLVLQADRLRFRKADGWVHQDSLFDPEEGLQFAYYNGHSGPGEAYELYYTDHGVVDVENYTF